jgi:hypothetical protein
MLMLPVLTDSFLLSFIRGIESFRTPPVRRHAGRHQSDVPGTWIEADLLTLSLPTHGAWAIRPDAERA